MADHSLTAQFGLVPIANYGEKHDPAHQLTPLAQRFKPESGS